MAGLKKKKKEKSGSPNTVLIIFLVFFFIVSIGLGVWGYYGYAGQEEIRAKQKSAEKALAPEKSKAAYYEMLYRDTCTSIGAKLDAAESAELKLYRDEFLKDGFGSFKNEKDKEKALDLMKDLRVRLGTVKDADDYASDFRKEIDTANAKLKEIEGKLGAAIAAKERSEEIAKRFTKNHDEVFKEALAKIDKGNADALAAIRAKSKEFDDIVKQKQDYKDEVDAKVVEIEKLKDDHGKAVTVLQRKINLYEAEAKLVANGGGGGGAPAARNTGDVFPLLLDISTGKPLWDYPVGKVSNVDMELRQVTINVGTAHGAKPELTFNIFGPNSSGRAEKQMKGSIEIIKVVDANTSIARITSLYDSDGREILMNLQTKGRVLRESESPIREGDLLFNLFWGTRVAVAGYVSITGDPSDNPEVQKRQMDDFLHLLKRNGMQVDAFVDMNDGHIEGNISSKTRYLIRGVRLGTTAPAAPAADKEPAAKQPDNDKDEKKDKDKDDKKDKDKDDKKPEKVDDKKAPAKDVAPNILERNAQINASTMMLLNDAREQGLLLVSGENFATLIGYRRARSANSVEPSAFSGPRLPYAGSPDGGVRENRPQEEKKGPEMEKNDGN